MSHAPGSFLWLVLHDMRLNWRRFADMFGTAGSARPWMITAAAILCAHLLAWPLTGWFAASLDAMLASGSSRGIIASALVSVLCWMTAQSLFATSRAIYDRSDLGLLLTAPVFAWRIFAAKAVAIVASILGSIGVLALPFANTLALQAGAHWLGAYPVLLSLAMLAAASAILLAIALFHVVGARRARVLMQLSGAAIGGGFVLGAQVIMLLPNAMHLSVLAWLEACSQPGTIVGAVIGAPIEALSGSVAKMLVLLGLCGSLLALAVGLLAGRFAAATIAAQGSVGGGRSVDPGSPIHFKGGIGFTLRHKEWRLLTRDATLFAQVSLQIIYTIPMVIVLLKGGSVPAEVAIAPAVVVIASQLAASLAWVTISGEDAPEFIASAPISAAAVDRAKLMAVAVPVLMLLAVPIAALASLSVTGALGAFVMAIGASVSTGLLNIWHPMPGSRRGMLRRHSQSKLLALIEHVIAVLWAVATVMLLLGVLHFLVLIAVAVLVLGLASPAVWPSLGRFRGGLIAGTASEDGVRGARAPGAA